MREVGLDPGAGSPEPASFAACLATILEFDLSLIPEVPAGEEAPDSVRRWLTGLGLGLVPIAAAENFAWAGPWIARVRGEGLEWLHSVVMFGVPSGVAWDPAGVTEGRRWEIADGFVVSALDIALARPESPPRPGPPGRVEAITLAPRAGRPVESVDRAQALAGRGLKGDRHVVGKGTFPSGVSGSALTLIEREVCDSFDPPLSADEHRRNLTTSGVDLNALVGHEFMIGSVRCRGARLCEPCRTVDNYSERDLLRPLVHRGGLRADILEDGEIAVGDQVHAVLVAVG